MEKKLIAYFLRIMPLSQAEIEAIVETTHIQFYPKGTILLQEGQISAEVYFVLEGCVRQYYMVEGDEKTNNFFTEGQWVISINSFQEMQPATHFMACCTDTYLVVGNREKEEDLYKRFPKLETVSRVVMQKVFAEQQQIMEDFLTNTPEQRYLKLLETRADLLQTIPQYQIASYIGVKPESLSRIRKRLLMK